MSFSCSSVIFSAVFLVVFLTLSKNVCGFHISTVGRSSILAPRVVGSAMARSQSRLRSTSLTHEAFAEIPSLATSPVLKIESDDQFTKYVENMKGVAMVDFFADWCGPCKMIAPIYLDLAKDLMPQVFFSKINVDDFPEIASKYEVEALPTFGVFYDGKLLAKQVGAKPKEGLKAFLSSTLQKFKGIVL